MTTDDKVDIQNINTPGRVEKVNREKYLATRCALLSVLPTREPGITVAEAKTAALPLLPESLFPGGATAGWWLKAAQLDLEAKGLVTRTPGSPLRLYRNESPSPLNQSASGA